MSTALITGASSGIGLELVKIFARDKAGVILVARKSERLRQAAAEIQQITGSAPRVMPYDLADPRSADAIHGELGGAQVDYLINNAGFGLGGPFSKTDRQIELEMLQVNIVSLVDLTKLLLPHMLARGSGRIMNVASTAAFQPGPLMAVYYASKAFVLSFTEAIAEEMVGSGVTVTALCPGPTTSDFQRRARIENVKLVKKQAIGMMSSEEVARIGYRGMMQGKVIVIPGFINRLGVQSLRLGPRAVIRKAARKLQEQET
ncbi:MAG TPA: SDR family oxidoreductase [Bryobacteraceae bacterium]